MAEITYQSRQRFLIRVLYILTVLLLGYFAIKVTLGYGMPFVCGALFALLARRLARCACAKIHFSEKAMGMITLCIFYLVLLGILWLTAAGCYQLVYPHLSSLPAFFQEKIAPMLSGLAQQLSIRIQNNSPWLLETFQNLQLFSAPVEALQPIIEKLASILTSALSKAPSFFMFAGMTVFASFLCMNDFPVIRSFFLRKLPLQTKAALRAKDALAAILSKLARAYGLLMLLTFCELLLGFALLKVPQPFLLAALTALLDIFPVLGTGTVLLPWAAIALLSGNLFQGIGLLVLYVIIGMVRGLLEPKLVGSKVGAPPLIMLLGAVAGAKLFGFWGFLLSPILLTFLKRAIVRISQGGSDGKTQSEA